MTPRSRHFVRALRAWTIRLAIVLVSTTVALLLVELGLWILDIVPTRSPYATQFIEHDSVRGWRNVPGATGYYTTDEFHTPLRYNERGFRGPLPDAGATRGRYRVVMLGDSFVEAFTVLEHERVSEVLERRLASSDTGTGVEVIALGTSGYANDQQLLWLEREAISYEPDLVVLMFYYNDIWGNINDEYSFGPKPRYTVEGDSLCLENVPVPVPDPRAGSQESIPRRAAVWLTEHSRIASLGSRVAKSSPGVRSIAIRLGLAEESARIAFDGPSSEIPSEFLPYGEPGLPAVDSAWMVTEALIARMRTISQGAGANFLVFYIPFRSTVQRGAGATPEDRSLPDIPLGADSVLRRLESVCARHSIDCVDPTGAFVAAARERASAGERLYFNYDWHWTAGGHALAGELLADHIVQRRAASLVP